MDPPKVSLLTKPITNSETTSFVIINKAKLALIFPRKVAKKHTDYETKRTLSISFSKSFGPTGRITESKSELLPMLNQKTAVTSATSKATETLPNKLNMSVTVDSKPCQTKLKLPAISSKNATATTMQNTTKTISATNMGTEQTLLSSRPIAESPSNCEHSIRRSQVRIVHNFRLVWLNSKTLKSSVHFDRSIDQLHQVMDAVNLFTDSEKCIDFLNKKTHETIFLIVSHDLAQSTISRVHDMFQLDLIFILGEKMPKDKQWIQDWPKVKNFYTCINTIYEIIKQETQVCRRDSIAISDTNVDLNHLDQSFMYTKLLKEILLEMTHDDKAKQEFTQFCRRKYDVNESDECLKIIDEFEQDYDVNTPIWWYTRDCFLYDMINRAFRLQEINVIIRTGFFIQDLQKRIEQLHKPPTKKLILYRGQGLLYADFDQLRTKPGGLFSFNSFLSTTMNRKLAHFYAESSRGNPKLTGILFQICVDPNVLTSARFASLDDESYYLDMEKEFLFTMHTVFRVGGIKKIEDRLWQVKLSLTSDDDEDLKQLTEYIRQETQGSTGWDRMGKLLLKVGNFDKAEEVFEVLIENSTENDMEERGYRYHMMGLVKKCKGDYEEALGFLDKALEIYQNFPDSNHLDLATIYNDIGLIYKHKGKYSTALECYRKTLDIQEKLIHVNNSDLAVTYVNIAEVHMNMEEYSEALQFQKKTLHIHKKSIPLNFLNLATTYQNIAETHYIMQDYPIALKLFRKVSSIRQHCLPKNDTDMATINNSIGQIHEKMGKYFEAVEHYKKALNLWRKSHPLNVSEAAIIHNNIAQMYKNMNEYAKALEFYQEILRILDRSPQLKKPDLATTHDNIGEMYKNMGKYYEAQISFRKAIAIAQQATPQNHFQLRSYEEHLAEVPKKLS